MWVDTTGKYVKHVSRFPDVLWFVTIPRMFREISWKYAKSAHPMNLLNINDNGSWLPRKSIATTLVLKIKCENVKWKCIHNWPLPIGDFQDQCKPTMINIIRLRIPTGGRQTSWLFISIAEKLNWGLLRTTSAGGLNGIWTRNITVFKSDALTTRPCCLPIKTLKWGKYNVAKGKRTTWGKAIKASKCTDQNDNKAQADCLYGSQKGVFVFFPTQKWVLSFFSGLLCFFSLVQGWFFCSEFSTWEHKHKGLLFANFVNAQHKQYEITWNTSSKVSICCKKFLLLVVFVLLRDYDIFLIYWSYLKLCSF